VCALDQADGVEMARSTLTGWTDGDDKPDPFGSDKDGNPGFLSSKNGCENMWSKGQCQGRKKALPCHRPKAWCNNLVLNILEKKIVMEISFLIHIVKTTKGRKELDNPQSVMPLGRGRAPQRIISVPVMVEMHTLTIIPQMLGKRIFRVLSHMCTHTLDAASSSIRESKMDGVTACQRQIFHAKLNTPKA